MKKTVSVITALIILTAFFCVTSAAETQQASPWSDKNIKINVYGTLDDLSDQTKIISDKTNIELTSGKIVVSKSEGTWIGANFSLQSVLSTKGALGAGFYVENNTDKGVWIVPIIYAGREMGPSASDEGKPLIVYDMTSGTYLNTSVQAWGTFQLYAGFKGYIALPFESYGVSGEVNINAAGIKYSPEADFNEKEGNIVFDNFFLYGYDIENKNSGLIEREVKDMEDIMKERQAQLIKDMAGLTSVTPEVTYMPAYDPQGFSNIKAITYDSVKIGEKKTKSFAYIGYPAGAETGDKLPAIVLIHGGGGHAFAEWVKYWNDNGYVAIAMDNTGFFPNNGNWVWGLEANPDFNETGYASVPQCDHFVSSGQPLDKQWMYHAVAQAILARNILAADGTVDANKIGVTGISWGGTITAQTIGFTKFAFAVPQYCSGYLNESMTYSANYCKIEGYNHLWKAEDRFDNVDFPVLWLQWSKDQSASIVSTTLCYLDTQDVSRMTLRMNWGHGHDWTTAIETVRFADWAVKGGEGLTKVLNQPDGTRNIDFNIELPKDAQKVSAQAYYITEKLTYKSGQPDQEFKSVKLTAEDGRITGTLPEEAYSFYVEIETQAGGKLYYVSTAFMDVDESNKPADSTNTPGTGSSPTAPVETLPAFTGEANITASASARSEEKNGRANTAYIIIAAAAAVIAAAGAAAYVFHKRKLQGKKN